MVLFCDFEKMAWNLIEVSTGEDVRMKRLDGNMFFIWTQKQISFCNTRPSGRVEEWTINFTSLGEIHFEQDHILLSYEEEGRTTVASYGLDGKLIKTHFEGVAKAQPEQKTVRQTSPNVRVKKKVENCA